jgi:hypothetical protein
MKIINIKFFLIGLLIVPEIIGDDLPKQVSLINWDDWCSEQSIEKLYPTENKHARIHQCCEEKVGNFCELVKKIEKCQDSTYLNNPNITLDELEECCRLDVSSACHSVAVRESFPR